MVGGNGRSSQICILCRGNMAYIAQIV